MRLTFSFQVSCTGTKTTLRNYINFFVVLDCITGTQQIKVVILNCQEHISSETYHGNWYVKTNSNTPYSARDSMYLLKSEISWTFVS